MNYFKGLAGYILLAVLLVAGSAYVVHGTRTFADEQASLVAVPAKAAVAVTPGRVETFGKNSPIITSGANVTLTYGDGEAPKDGPKVLDQAPMVAVTHGDNSPVVIAHGGSVTITYK